MDTSAVPIQQFKVRAAKSEGTMAMVPSAVVPKPCLDLFRIKVCLILMKVLSGLMRGRARCARRALAEKAKENQLKRERKKATLQKSLEYDGAGARSADCVGLKSKRTRSV